MKKPLKNAAIYFVTAGAFFIALLASPEPIAFYGALLFYVIHLPGVALVGLFTFAYGSDPFGRFAVVLMLITVNAAVVFLMAWLRTKRWNISAAT